MDLTLFNSKDSFTHTLTDENFSITLNENLMLDVKYNSINIYTLNLNTLPYDSNIKKDTFYVLMKVEDTNRVELIDYNIISKERYKNSIYFNRSLMIGFVLVTNINNVIYANLQENFVNESSTIMSEKKIDYVYNYVDSIDSTFTSLKNKERSQRFQSLHMNSLDYTTALELQVEYLQTLVNALIDAASPNVKEIILEALPQYDNFKTYCDEYKSVNDFNTNIEKIIEQKKLFKKYEI